MFFLKKKKKKKLQQKLYHLVSAANKYCDCARVGTFLNDQHAILRRSKRNLLHHASLTQFVWGDFCEARNDSTASGNCYQLLIQTVVIKKQQSTRSLLSK